MLLERGVVDGVHAVPPVHFDVVVVLVLDTRAVRVRPDRLGARLAEPLVVELPSVVGTLERWM